MEGLILVVILFILIVIILPIVAFIRSSDAAGRIRRLEQRLNVLEANQQRILIRLRRGEGVSPPPQDTGEPEAGSHPMPPPAAIPDTPIARPVDAPAVTVTGTAADIPQPETAETEEAEPAATEHADAAVEADEAPAAPEPDVPLQAEPALAARAAEEDAVPEAPRQRHAVPQRSRGEWEALIGGKLLNRIGALALILGAIFFLKYAFDNNWISEELRVGLGGLAGIGLLFLGDRTRSKGYEIFAQGIVGAGIAILYVAVFAAFNFYELVSQFAAFMLMSGVTAVAIWRAIQYNSLAISLLGLAGGFLTPAFLSTGSTNAPGLFGYILLLDCGLLAVVLFRRLWPVLEFLAFICTYLWYALWRSTAFYDTPVEELSFAITWGFHTLFWLLFQAIELYHLRSEREPGIARRVMGLANALVYWIFFYLAFDYFYEHLAAEATFGLSLVYGAILLFVHYKTQAPATVVAGYALTAIAMFVGATLLEFEDHTLAILLSLEALALLWCALHWRLSYVRLSAYIVYLIAAVSLFAVEDIWDWQPVAEFTLLFNLRVLAFAVLVGALQAGAWLLSRSDRSERKVASAVLHLAWIFLAFILIGIETGDHFDYLRGLEENSHRITTLRFMNVLVLSFAWFLFGQILAQLGMWRGKVLWLHAGSFVTGISLMVIMFGGFDYRPIEHFSVLTNMRSVIMLLMLGGLALLYSVLRKRYSEFTLGNLVRVGCASAILLVSFVLVSAETLDVFDKPIQALVSISDNTDKIPSDRIHDLRNQQQLWLSIVWLLYSIALMALGFWRKQRYLRYASIALFGVAILKIFIMDLSFLETLYRIFSFIGLGVILLAVSYLYARFKTVITGEESPADEIPDENPTG